MKKLLDQFDVVDNVKVQDIDTADITGTYVPVGSYTTGYAMLLTEALGATKKATISVMQRLGAAGAEKIVGEAVEITHPTQFAEISFNISDLDIAGGYDRVALKITCDAAATPKKFGAGVLMLGGKRYAG